MRAIALAGTLIAALAATGAGLSGAQVPIQTGRAGASSATGILAGTVANGLTGEPIPDAVVALSCNPSGGPGSPQAGRGGGRGPAGPDRVLVDGQGRFVFRNVPAGPCSLIATKAGYLGGGFNQRTPLGSARPVELFDAERLGGIALKLWPFGVLTGDVTDESGAPMTQVTVQLLKRVGSGGQWRLLNSGISARTDDRGIYRLGSVPPGAYAVMVRSGTLVAENLLVSLLMGDESAAMKMLPMLLQRGEDSILLDNGVTVVPAMYYPDTPNASQAATITVGPGELKSNLDFHVRRAQVHSIRGTVSGQSADAAAGGRVTLHLRSADPSASDSELAAADASSDTNGRFIFIGVPSGDYVVDAMSRSGFGAQSAASGEVLPDSPVLVASAPITVGDSNIKDVSLTLRPPPNVTGRVEFGGTARPPNDMLTHISVTLDPVGPAPMPGISRGRVETDGTFKVSSMLRGRYVMRVSKLALPATGALAQPGVLTTWSPQSAIVNGRDALDQDFQIDETELSAVVITFTDKPAARLIGTVRDAKSAADPQAAVLVFPTDSRLWSDFSSSARRIRIARTSRTGSFVVPDLPPGEYFVVAGTDDDFLGREAPGALEALSRLGTRVVIVEGQPKALDLRSGGK